MKCSQTTPFRKFGAIELPLAAGLSVANTDSKQGRFDSTNFSPKMPFQESWCSRTSALSDNEDSDRRFDSTKLSERFPSENLVLSTRPSLLSYAMQILTTDRGSSMAPHFLKDPSDNLVLSNRCVIRQ